MKLTGKSINIIIGLAVVVVLAITVIGVFASANNKVVKLEETINTSQSNISKEEQRRVDLFNNLVDAVQSYNQFEQATLEKVIQARQQANGGQIENAQLTLAAVVEAYPQLKSQDNYKQAMLEFSITENRLAQYREQYNGDVKSYNQAVRTFPRSMILAIMGYDKKDYKYLDFNVDNAEARDLFKNE